MKDIGDWWVWIPLVLIVVVVVTVIIVTPPNDKEYIVTGQVADYTYSATKFNEYDTITIEFNNGNKTTWRVDHNLANEGITLQIGQNYIFHIKNDELYKYELSSAGTVKE